MFRELLRKNKALPKEECINLLEKETRGVLSVVGDEGYPYGMPMNHFYDSESGNIWFHCGKKGHRLDSIKKEPKVSFCVFEKGTKTEEDWAFSVRSVVVFGKIEIVDDPETIGEITAKLSRKFTSDEDYIKNEIEKFGKETLLLKLVPEHISGKTVKES
ncbi:MAG: pyridoxamine 5'-phosphate oxidase family protein [Oscillospiraceae bacterium]|nr:pyridoxamine 5'-phosphate oxidase family protein [Oscillospiraceae bacterium]